MTTESWIAIIGAIFLGLGQLLSLYFQLATKAKLAGVEQKVDGTASEMRAKDRDQVQQIANLTATIAKLDRTAERLAITTASALDKAAAAPAVEDRSGRG